MTEKILFEQDRSMNRTVRLTLTEYQGKPLLDLRNYYRDWSGNLKPTRQGIQLISPEMVDDLAVILQDASTELRNALKKSKVEQVEKDVV